VNPEVNHNSPINPEPEKIGSAEQTLIDNLGSKKKSLVIKTCEALGNLASRGVDTSSIAVVAIPELIQILVATEDQDTRRAARKAIVSLDPELKKPTLEFVDQLESKIVKKINDSGVQLFSGNYTSGKFPYAEHILIAGTIITEAFMRERFSEAGIISAAKSKFVKMALDGGLGNRTIKETPDQLSMIRPTLPLELGQLQNNLDSLFELSMISRPITVIKMPSKRFNSASLGLEKDRSLRDSLMRTVGPNDELMLPAATQGYSKSDFLCKELAAVASYEKASIIVRELGEVGEPRATQALKQASMGFMNSRGYAMQFPSAQHSQDFKDLCEEAIRKINARESVKKRGSF